MERLETGVFPNALWRRVSKEARERPNLGACWIILRDARCAGFPG